MAGTPNKFSRFWQEAKRRKTDKVLVIYAATAFTILQLAEPVKSGLSLPDWTTTFIIIVLAVGFPVAAIFSWLFDITPGGIEKTKPAGDRKKQTTEAELRTWKSTTLISVIIIIALILLNVVKGTFGAEAANATGKSITVQPIGCLNDEKELQLQGEIYTYFINGTLTGIENLTLRTWPPNLNYQVSKKSYPEIGKELNVSFILKGTLSKLTNRIVFIVQLIRAKSANILWANNYELDLEGNNFYEVQRDIAFHISSSLNAGLSKREKNRISKKPSSNPSAMRSYLEGSAVSQQVIFNATSGKRFFEELINSKLFENAIYSFDQAIKNDSAFALAYAKRAIIRSWAYHTGLLDKTSIEKCKADVDKALELDKGLIEARIALGLYYYYCTYEFQKALENFSYANTQQPNDWQCLYYMALVHRALGNWQKTQRLFSKVLKFNPQDPLLLTNIGLSEFALHNYDKAVFYHNKAIEIMPNWSAAYENKIDAIIQRDGKTSEARIVLDSAIEKTGDHFTEIRIQLDIYDGKFEAALHEIELSEPSDFSSSGERFLKYAEIYRYLNKSSTALAFFKSALSFYAQELAHDPENCKNLSFIGLAYAGLDNKAEAVESGEKAIILTKNGLLPRTDRMIDLAKIYIMAGEYDKCLGQLEYLLKNPSNFSVKLLQLDPVWKPLQHMPGYTKLISQYSGK
jgi:tetratricopeptide (TPR) repeat protein